MLSFQVTFLCRIESKKALRGLREAMAGQRESLREGLPPMLLRLLDATGGAPTNIPPLRHLHHALWPWCG